MKDKILNSLKKIEKKDYYKHFKKKLHTTFHYTKFPVFIFVLMIIYLIIFLYFIPVSKGIIIDSSDESSNFIPISLIPHSQYSFKESIAFTSINNQTLIKLYYLAEFNATQSGKLFNITFRFKVETLKFTSSDNSNFPFTDIIFSYETYPVYTIKNGSTFIIPNLITGTTEYSLNLTQKNEQYLIVTTTTPNNWNITKDSFSMFYTFYFLNKKMPNIINNEDTISRVLTIDAISIASTYQNTSKPINTVEALNNVLLQLTTDTTKITTVIVEILSFLFITATLIPAKIKEINLLSNSYNNPNYKEYDLLRKVLKHWSCLNIVLSMLALLLVVSYYLLNTLFTNPMVNIVLRMQIYLVATIVLIYLFIYAIIMYYISFFSLEKHKIASDMEKQFNISLIKDIAFMILAIVTLTYLEFGGSIFSGLNFLW